MIPSPDSPYVYPASLVRVVDGDTVILRLRRVQLVDFGFRFKVETCMSFEADFRVLGIDTPELRSSDPQERELAQAAKLKVQQLLALGPLTVESHKSDKYGRWLCTIWIKTPEEELDLSVVLVDLKLAVPYDGKGARQPWVFPPNTPPEETP